MKLKPAIPIIATVLLSACASNPAQTVAKQPLDGGCVAMRSHFPITYSQSKDTQETKAQVMDANAAFKAACP